MSFYLNCPKCEKNVRNKETRSKISRGKSFPCPRCGFEIPTLKKENGKFVRNK